MSVDLNTAFRVKLNGTMLSTIFLELSEVADFIKELEDKVENECNVVVTQGDKVFFEKTLYPEAMDDDYEEEETSEAKELLIKINELIEEFLKNN